jgi:hypothetical protein
LLVACSHAHESDGRQRVRIGPRGLESPVPSAKAVDVVAPPDTPGSIVFPVLARLAGEAHVTTFGLAEPDGIQDVGIADGRTEGLVLAMDARGLTTFYSTDGGEGTMAQPAYRGDLAGGARIFASIAARHPGALVLLELDPALPFRVLQGAARAAHAAGFERIAVEIS